MSHFVLALDFGHGGGKACFLDLDNGNIGTIYQQWKYYSPDDNEFLKEFKPKDFFYIICNLVRALIKKYHISPDDICGISTSSMRHAYVFLDKSGNELYAGPNIDTRGLFYQDVIEEELSQNVYSLTGQWPPLLFLLTRLIWFREEKEEIFNSIYYVLTVGDWLLYKLTGTIATEPSLASETMIFNIRKKQWIKEFLDVLGCEHIHLPELSCAGEYGGDLLAKAANQMGLPKGIPVSIGGADSQLGLLACSAVQDNDLSVIAGTSIPVMKVISSPRIDPQGKLWTHCHIIPNRWVMESNAQMGGLSYRWLKDNFQKILGKTEEKTYEYLEKMALSIPIGSDDMMTSLGSEILDIHNLSIVRPGVFLFPQPGNPFTATPITFNHFIRSTLENIAYAIRGNVAQLRGETKKTLNNVRITGGMSRNKVFLHILADVLGTQVIATKNKEGTAMGCAACAAVGAGMFPNLVKAAREIIKLHKPIIPNQETQRLYDGYYKKWKTIYDTIADF